MINPKRGIVALVVALVLAMPAWFEQAWVSGFAAPFIILLNLPGILLGLAAGGRFFPPEGIIGQSPIRFVFMVIVQSVIWYLLISLIQLLTRRARR